MIQKNISLSGDTNFLKDLIKNRITDRMLHKITENSKQSLTIHFETGNYLKNKIDIPSIIVRPWHKQIIPFALDNCIELHVRDLMCVDSEGGWGPKDISDWIDALETKNTINLEKYPVRFWTSKNDIITLIETLIEIPEIPTLVTEVCGRRPWFANDTFSELKMLWRRINNSKLNQIDIIDLEVKEIQNSSTNYDYSTPNLSDLHNLLKIQNGKGWVTNTPIRISLMECLEEIIKF